MKLYLSKIQAEALERELRGSTDALGAVHLKLAQKLSDAPPEQIPGQTSIDDMGMQDAA